MNNSKTPLIVSVSGIRGIAGESLTPEIAVKYAASFGMLSNRGTIVVGRDTRTSGEMFKNAVFAGLASVGSKVIDIGICPTPTVQVMTEKLKASGGIVITASHNPGEWNGLKMFTGEGIYLIEKELNTLSNIYNENDIRYALWKSIGKYETYDSAIEDHIEKILDLPYIRLGEIAKKRYKVVVDCVNGAGGKALPYLLRKLGCTVFPMYCETDGVFPHVPEPLPENITELCEKVRFYNADIGFAVDPDSDRLAVVDETGTPLGEEYTVALAAKFILSKKKGDVVVNETTTRAVEDVAAKYNAGVVRSKVGEINVVQKMKEINSPIGGEGNGGVILPDVHYGRDALVGVTLIMQMLSENDKSIGKIKKDLPEYFIMKKKIQISDTVYGNLIKKITSENSEKYLSFTDGLKLSKNGWWIHIRKSRTEPVVRIIGESKSQKKLKEIFDDIEKTIKTIKDSTE
ncbi:phosphoglucosamine mutase [bacterium]|nr:phosphoglucosamine mutase [bacterium]